MTVFEKVQEILSTSLKVDASKITPETNLKNDLGADSLDVVEAVMGLEEEYGIVFEDDMIQSIKTVGDLVQYVEEHK